LIYDYISPQAIFVAFILAMILSIFGTLGTEKTSPPVKSGASSSGEKVGFQHLIKDNIFLGYLLIIFLFSGANNTGHTY
ncbi:MFS transporter, partial [Streptococcus pyogenes]